MNKADHSDTFIERISDFMVREGALHVSLSQIDQLFICFHVKKEHFEVTPNFVVYERCVIVAVYMVQCADWPFFLSFCCVNCCASWM